MPNLVIASPQPLVEPEIGSQVIVRRPPETAYLPTIYIGEKVRMLQDTYSWYTYDSGPQITAFLNPDYTGYKKTKHILYYKDAPCVLAELVKIGDEIALFEVVASAPAFLCQQFENTLMQLSDKLTHKQILTWASDWWHHQFVSIRIPRSGHDITFNWGPSAKGLLANQLLQDLSEFYNKLPSGSGWDNHWSVAWMKDFIEAETSFSPMNDVGYYVADVDLSYNLRWFDGKWQVEDKTNHNQEVDEDVFISFDDFAQQVEEALNAS